jgi:hypothetical protein
LRADKPAFATIEEPAWVGPARPRDACSAALDQPSVYHSRSIHCPPAGRWNLDVTPHAHGVVTGADIDAAGRPLSGALIRLHRREFVSQQEKARTMSDQDGRFRFDGNTSGPAALVRQ